MTKGGPVTLILADASGAVLASIPVGMNHIMPGMADAKARALFGDLKYVISGAYLEFSNAGSPTTPTVDPENPADGQPYYAGLSGSPDGDFIRATLTGPMATLSTDSAKYQGNQTQVLCTTSETVGHFGKPFSAGAGSKLIGGALVARPTGDFGGDIVVSRIYFPSAVAVIPGAQCGLSWPLTFKNS